MSLIAVEVPCWIAWTQISKKEDLHSWPTRRSSRGAVRGSQIVVAYQRGYGRELRVVSPWMEDLVGLDVDQGYRWIGTYIDLYT